MLDAAMRHRPSGADAVELLLARCRLWVGFGDVEAADRDLDAVATVLAGGGARHVLPMLTLRAGLAMWQGRHAEARAAVQRGLTETRSDDLVLLGVLAWHGLRAEAEAHAGGQVPVDPAAVRRLQVVVERMAKGVGNAAAAGARGGRRLPRPVRGRAEPDRGAATTPSRGPGRPRRGTGASSRTRRPTPGCGRPRRRSHRRHRGGRPRPRALRQAYATAQAMGARPFAAEITAVAARARVALAGDDATVALARAGARPRRRAGRADRPGARGAGGGGRGADQPGDRPARCSSASARSACTSSHIFDKLQVRTRVQASRVFLRTAWQRRYLLVTYVRGIRRSTDPARRSAVKGCRRSGEHRPAASRSPGGAGGPPPRVPPWRNDDRVGLGTRAAGHGRPCSPVTPTTCPPWSISSPSSRTSWTGCRRCSASNPLADFNRLYLTITTSVLERLYAGRFADPAFLSRLDVEFAARYFDALRHVVATRAPAARGPGRCCSTGSPARTARPLPSAAAGVNAHINFDLPFALVTTFDHLGSRPGRRQRPAPRLPADQRHLRRVDPRTCAAATWRSGSCSSTR